MAATTLDAFFERYRKAFASTDMEALAKLIHLPCLIASGPDLIALNDSGDLRDRFQRQFDRHREAQVEGAAFEILGSRRLAPRIARADVRWTFRRAAGEALPSFGLSYTLVDPEAGWRIATVFPLEL